MAQVFDRVKVVTTTTGTGNLTLGAAESGYRTFAEAGAADGATVNYIIEDGTNWEIGTGQLGGGGTILSRNVVSSSNGNAAIDLSGTARIFSGLTKADVDGKADVGHTHSYLPLTGGSLSGKLTITGGGEVLRAAGAASYFSFWNADQSTRLGYVQHTGTTLAIANDAGAITLAPNGGVATVTLTNSAATFGTSVILPDSYDLSWGGTYTQNKPTISGGVQGVIFYPSGASGGEIARVTTTGVRSKNFYDANGGNNVNLGSNGQEGRGVVAGFSGGNYGAIGYNIRFTGTSDSWVAPLGDTSSMVSFASGGVQFHGWAAGAAGRTLSASQLGAIDVNGNMSLKGTSLTLNGKAVSTTDHQHSTLLIADTRAAQKLPNDHLGQAMSVEFTNQITSLPDWRSVITMKGWTNGYRSWQLIGPSSTGESEELYFRTGNNTTWGTARKVFHEGNVNPLNLGAGSRPISYNYGGGNLSIKGDSGGWATGYFFEGSAGANLGGFGMIGGGNSFSYYWIGSTYDATTSFKVYPNGDAYVNGRSLLTELDAAKAAAPAVVFNNGGQTHGKWTDFNTLTLTPGVHFVQTGTNGPGTGAGQFYVMNMGLGGEYAFSSYGVQIAIPRKDATGVTGDTYLSIRYREGGGWSAWNKIKAGRADGLTSGAVAEGNVTFSNVRDQMIGIYDPGNTQGIWAMGAAYALPAGGVSTQYGNHYGLAWSYEPGYGSAGSNPQSKAGLSHQLLIQHAGVTRTAIGSGIWTIGNIYSNSNAGQPVRADRLYRSDDQSGYFLQHTWTGAHWFLRGHTDSGFHAEVRVGYADNAGALGGYAASSWLGLNGNSYYQVGTWLQFNGTYGLYWPGQSLTHIQPEDGTYGSLQIQGSKGGYSGIRFRSMAGEPRFMTSGYGGSTGFYSDTYGWDWYFSGADLICRGNLTAYSDAKLKTNLRRIENALDKVCQLNGYVYDRTDIEKTDVGAIAQEVQAVLPEAVTESEDGILKLNYAGATFALTVEAIKELVDENQALKARLARIEEALGL